MLSCSYLCTLRDMVLLIPKLFQADGSVGIMNFFSVFRNFSWYNKMISEIQHKRNSVRNSFVNKNFVHFPILFPLQQKKWEMQNWIIVFTAKTVLTFILQKNSKIIFQNVICSTFLFCHNTSSLTWPLLKNLIDWLKNFQNRIYENTKTYIVKNVFRCT